MADILPNNLLQQTAAANSVPGASTVQHAAAATELYR